ncbi:9685_t:CDS:2, partial [Funneliformis caledonium]
ELNHDIQKNDINTIDEAKGYSNYYGGVLKPEEKAIFDSNLLNPNDILDKTLLQDTAQLLNNCREGKEKVKVEKMGLSSESHNLLASILKEQKAESIPYQVVNNLNDNKPVDKVVRKREKIDKEIKELKKKYNDSLEKKQTVLETKVNAAVATLKNDLRTVSAGGRRFFEETIKSNKIVSEEKYKSDTPAIPDETYGSVIKTNINASSNGKSYTNAVYLNLKLKLFGFGNKSTMTGVSNEKYVKENMETHRYMSDIFYVMHALFPKDSNYSNSPFIQKGEDASIIGKNYVTSPGGSVIYNNDKAIDFSACHTVLSSDAVNDEIIQDEISVYENKIRLKYSSLANSSILVDKYEKYVENLLKGLTKAGTTTPIFQKGELESLQETYPENEVVDKFDDDVTNENTKLDVEEIANQDDGKFFNDEVIKNYLQSIKDSLESVGQGLDPVKQNELDQLTYYIENSEVPPPKRRILPIELKGVLGVKTNVFNPEIVVETIALQELKADSNLKVGILNEMKKFKEDQKGLIRLDLSVYENGEEFSEEGIIKYYAEKLGGQDHVKKKYEKLFKNQQQEVF